MEEKPAPEPLYLDFAYSLHPLRFDGPEGESLWKVGLAFHLDDDEEFTIVFDPETAERLRKKVLETLEFIRFNEGREN